jgi:hypothetical protein
MLGHLDVTRARVDAASRCVLRFTVHAGTKSWSMVNVISKLSLVMWWQGMARSHLSAQGPVKMESGWRRRVIEPSSSCTSERHGRYRDGPQDRVGGARWSLRLQVDMKGRATLVLKDPITHSRGGRRRSASGSPQDLATRCSYTRLRNSGGKSRNEKVMGFKSGIKLGTLAQKCARSRPSGRVLGVAISRMQR